MQMLAVAGLAAYVLSWLLLPFHDYWTVGEALKNLLGFEALSWLAEDFTIGFAMLLGALSGYTLLAIVILSSKKSS